MADLRKSLIRALPPEKVDRQRTIISVVDPDLYADLYWYAVSTDQSMSTAIAQILKERLQHG